MSFDVFKFVALRPPEAISEDEKTDTVEIEPVTATEALDIYKKITGADGDDALKAVLAGVGASKSISALLISGVDSAVINKVIAISDMASKGSVVVAKNTNSQYFPSSENTLVNSMNLNTGLTRTLSPNLLGSFRVNNFDALNATDDSALNEGISDNVGGSTSNDTSGSALNEEITDNVGGLGTSNTLDNLFNEGPITPVGGNNPKQAPEVDVMPSFFRPVGVGELQIVQQDLHRYELGEIAYVENVLASEFRERMHRQTNEQEISLFDEEETEQFMEQNLQSSERFELQTAARDELERRNKVENNLSVSGKYGPTVEIKAGMQFSHESSKRSSKERSAQFAQEVTESAVQRTQSKVKESRSEITRSKTEQSNIHRFDNTGADAEHIAGVYRYVDKIYKMRLVNRGVRFFYEFYIPSPGAYLRQISTNNTKVPKLTLPPKPSVKIKDITPTSYLSYVEQYNVRNVPAPPKPTETLTVSASDADSGTGGAQKVRKEGALSIPDGYVVDEARVSITAFNDHTTDPQVWVTIGADTETKVSGWPELEEKDKATVFTFAKAKGQRGTLGYSLYARHDATVQFLIEVRCKISKEQLLEWQHKIYDAIMETYQAQVSQTKADFAEKMAGLSVTDLIDAPPARLRELERDELKRLCMQLMGGEAMLAEERATSEVATDIPLVVERGEGAMLEGNLPISRKRLDPLATEARFAEQAFEWSNLSFTLYPYYWNEPNEWAKLVSLSHPDPLHGNFLRSGIARVLVPIRENYEEAVRDFVFRGRPALYSSEPANITDEKWLPLHQEMREATQRNQEGDRLISSWFTRISTPLVMLDANVQVDEHGHMMQRKDEEGGD